MTKYTINEVNKVDKEIRTLCGLYSSTKITIGMELAQRLYIVENEKLYLKIDSKSYPNFSAFIASIGMSYHSVRELISTYRTFVLTAGYSIEELSGINYQKLAVIKPELFSKKDGEYILNKSKSEINKWLSDAKSDISINDLKQKRREMSVGDHEHSFEVITYKQCVKCGLKVK